MCVRVVRALRSSGFFVLASQITVVPEAPSVSPYISLEPAGNGPAEVGTDVGVPGAARVTVAHDVGTAVGVSGDDGVCGSGEGDRDGFGRMVGGGVTGVGFTEGLLGVPIGDWNT